jgi:hypothetical protein
MPASKIELPGLPGFGPVTTVDELASAIAIFSEKERVALMHEMPVVIINKKTKAVAILRPDDDGSWNVEVFEPGVGERCQQHHK